MTRNAHAPARDSVDSRREGKRPELEFSAPFDSLVGACFLLAYPPNLAQFSLAEIRDCSKPAIYVK